MFNCKNNLPFDLRVILHSGIDYEAELIYRNKRVVKDELINLMKDDAGIKNIQKALLDSLVLPVGFLFIGKFGCI